MHMSDDFPLLLSTLYDRSVRAFPGQAISSVEADGSVYRATYRETDVRTRKLATAFDALGLDRDAVIGSFGWNTHRHHELYWATANTGRVLHTLNIRLFADQLIYVVNHAEDKAVFVDVDLLPLIEPHADKMPTVEHWIVMGGSPADSCLEGAISYEDLIAAQAPLEAWPEVDERSPMMLCYTSGTTGHPKGVAYTQRSTYLHTMANMSTTQMSPDDNLLAIVPMFHAAAWGLAYVAVVAGAKITYPGHDMSAEGLVRRFRDEEVTFSAGVPTVFIGMQQYLIEHPDLGLPSIRRLLCGGSAVPRGLMKWFLEAQDIEMGQAWGMTELNPVASVALITAEMKEWPLDKQLDVMETVGIAMPGLQMKIVDDEGIRLPEDGIAFGELLIRGPWVAAEYYRDDRSEFTFQDGWMRTGDVCTINGLGYVKITDRAKDVIKSGGEWISSLDLENTLMGHPDVAEAVVVGLAHPKWDERPMAFVVPRSGTSPHAGDLLEWLAPQFAKWWLPDELRFIDEIPKTGTGKFDKKVLRAEFADEYMA